MYRREQQCGRMACAVSGEQWPTWPDGNIDEQGEGIRGRQETCDVARRMCFGGRSKDRSSKPDM